MFNRKFADHVCECCGEVPRTYFFDRQHRVERRSGRLDGAWVEGWLKSAPGPQR